MSGAMRETVFDLLRRQRDAVEQHLREVLTARGIDPDDRTDGWEDRARAALGEWESVSTFDMTDYHRMTVTTEFRPATRGPIQ